MPDEIKIAPLFDAAGYAHWWIHTTSTLKRACGRTDDKVVEWFTECKTKSLDELKNSGKRFAELDIMLADALKDAAKRIRILGIKLHQYTLTEQSRNARVPKGRELMWHINAYFKSSVNAEQLYTFKDLQKVEYVKTGCHYRDLEDFVSRWEVCFANLKYDIPPEMLASLFYDQVKKCAEMRETWFHWEEMHDDNPEKNYEWLAKRVDAHVTQWRTRSNRGSISAHIASMNDNQKGGWAWYIDPAVMGDNTTPPMGTKSCCSCRQRYSFRLGGRNK